MYCGGIAICEHRSVVKLLRSNQDSILMLKHDIAIFRYHIGRIAMSAAIRRRCLAQLYRSQKVSGRSCAGVSGIEYVHAHPLRQASVSQSPEGMIPRNGMLITLFWHDATLGVYRKNMESCLGTLRRMPPSWLMTEVWRGARLNPPNTEIWRDSMCTEKPEHVR